MRSKQLTSNAFDDDTFKVLDIALKFLETYFGYSPEQAESLMKLYFEKFPNRFDEDAIHHASSYRMAAIIHYLAGIGGDPNEVGNWVIANRFHQPPPEALDYFRRNYFEGYR